MECEVYENDVDASHISPYIPPNHLPPLPPFVTAKTQPSSILHENTMIAKTQLMVQD